MEVERGSRDGIYEGFPLRSHNLNDCVSRSPSPSDVGSIEHRVSKKDTLAGIAIKYGVEVADIKRMNGLVTDLQMFAYKKLQIPLPGRHTPSPELSDGPTPDGELTPPSAFHDDVMSSFHSIKLTPPPPPPRRRVSDAMINLQGYYGLMPPPRPRPSSSEEGMEMSVYRSSNTSEIQELTPQRLAPVPTQNHRAIRSSFDDGGGIASLGEMSEHKDRRRRFESNLGTPELLIKEESRGSAAVAAASSRNGKGLALRPKSGSRTDLPSAGNAPATVRKSSSASNLVDSDTSSLWPTSRWKQKTDAITRPLLDGLPKPITFLKTKAARD